MPVTKIAYLTYQFFCLGFLRPFTVGFCPVRRNKTIHSKDILLPNIVLSFFQFFQFYVTLAVFARPNLNFFSTSMFSEIWHTFSFWKFGACSFHISDSLKTPALLYFEKKLHMINEKSRGLSEFLKITYD